MEQKGGRSKEGTGMKILIADDNSKNLYLLEVLLKSAGYEVVTANDGIEALEKLHAIRFDGVVSDILMPRMDGFMLLRECKKDPVFRQIPFIFYTATYLEQKDEEFGLNLGAIRYIIKPAKPEELLRQIHEAFLEHARFPRDYTTKPVLDEVTFTREYTQRVGAKLEKKIGQLKESEEMFRLLYENSLDAILLTSPDGSIQAANPAACAMFQQTEEEILKKGRVGIIDTTDPRLPPALEERARTDRFKGELTFLRKDGTPFPGEVSSNIFTDRLGQTRTSMFIRDISERKRIEVALRDSEKFLNSIVEQIPDMIFVKDAQDLRFVRFNRAGEDLLGHSREELLGKNDYDIFPKHEADFFCEMDKEVLFKNQLIDIPDEKIQTRYKGERILHTKKLPIVDEKGEPRYLLGISEDITDRKRAEEALQETKDYLENLIRYANVPIISWDPELKITEFNRAFEKMNGMTRDGVIGQPLEIIFPDKIREKTMDLIRRALSGEQWEVVEIPIRHVSGETRIVLWNSSNILDPMGTVIATIAQGQDITDRKAAEEAMIRFNEDLERRVTERTSDLSDVNQKLVAEIDIRLDAEKQLAKSVGEKDVLLREVHHRVKNNLQIIISLLNLQSRYMTDETTLSAFRESQNRIKAMALVHEKLYLSTDVSKINLDNYIRFLGNNLIQFFGMKGKGITLTLDIRDISLAIDTAIPLGLMMNELISNSLKYAFPNARKGEISVTIHRQDMTLTILFKDNGVGIPADFDWRNAKSLGLRLVISLVEQLQGTIELDRTAGIAFNIVVKEKQ
jgi:PAS domain S-box-containing protein